MKTHLILLVATALLCACKPTTEVATANASIVNRSTPAPAPAPPAPKDREISGTVFIATKGGSVVKLAAVEVKAFEWEAVNKAMTAGRKAAAELDVEATERARTKGLAAGYASQEVVEAREALGRARSNTLNVAPASRAATLRPFEERLDKAETEHRALTAAASREWAAVGQFRELAQSGEAGLANLKEGLVIVATTDAEGAFKLRLPAERQVVLVARARRLVGRNEESYLWAHTVPKDEAGPVHLSNANLLR